MVNGSGLMVYLHLFWYLFPFLCSCLFLEEMGAFNPDVRNENLITMVAVGTYSIGIQYFDGEASASTSTLLK